MFRPVALAAPILAVCLCLAAAACSDERPAREVTGAQAGGPALHRLSIRLGDLAARVAAPAGAVSATRFAATRVHVPDRRFAITIEPARGSLGERKRVIEGNRYNQFRGYIEASDDALLYRSERDGQTEHHVLVRVTLDDRVYQCVDDKLAATRPASLAEAHTMLRACRSLRTSAPKTEP